MPQNLRVADNMLIKGNYSSSNGNIGGSRREVSRSPILNGIKNKHKDREETNTNSNNNVDRKQAVKTNLDLMKQNSFSGLIASKAVIMNNYNIKTDNYITERGEKDRHNNSNIFATFDSKIDTSRILNTKPRNYSKNISNFERKSPITADREVLLNKSNCNN